MTLRYYTAAELVCASGHSLQQDDDAQDVWRISAHEGFAVVGPYASAANGVYRVKARARVLSPPPAQSYFEVIDLASDGRIYASETFREGPEVYVRVLATEALEFRFRTAGETLEVHGVELEPVLLDDADIDAGDLRDLIGRLHRQNAELPALLRAVDRLSDLGDREGAERLRLECLKERAATNAGREAWRRLLKLHGPVATMPSQIEEQALTWEEVGETTTRLKMTVLDLLSPTVETRDVLRSLGYEADHLNATRLHRDYDEPPRPWHDRRTETGRPPEHPSRQPLFEPYPLIDRSHQASMARGRGFAAYCPVTGELLRTQHGFLVHREERIFIFYRLEGVEVFYVCTGTDSDSKMFVYMPRTQTICLLSDPWHRSYHHQQLVRDLCFNLLINADDCGRYLSSPTRPAAVHGNFNYGHFFWCDLSGLQFAVESGLHDGLAGMIKTPSQFIEVEALFPELADKPIHDCANQVYAFQAAVRNRYLPIHFTNTEMNDAFVMRLRAWGRAHAEPSKRPPATIARPLIWLNLRAHNKIWADQVQGYANILNALHEEHGAVSALLDGVEDCRPLAEGIRAQTRPEITLYDGLDFSLADKLAWAAAVDAYIVVIGTGLMIVHSMGGAKGVAHGNREHLTQLGFWESIQPGSGTPIGPKPDEITDVGPAVLQRDYDVDWRVLLNLLRPVLAARLSASELPIDDRAVAEVRDDC
jgi:hypothetical protein